MVCQRVITIIPKAYQTIMLIAIVITPKLITVAVAAQVRLKLRMLPEMTVANQAVLKVLAIKVFRLKLLTAIAKERLQPKQKVMLLADKLMAAKTKLVVRLMSPKLTRIAIAKVVIRLVHRMLMLIKLEHKIAQMAIV